MIRRLFLLITVSSAMVLVAGLWIPFKAIVAQELLELAWAESQARQTETRPWPWADTVPVARLSLPELEQSMIVLSDTSGESLAFGPGQLAGGEGPVSPVVIAGHRDTHFRWLKHLAADSEILLQQKSGATLRYRVEQIRVVDSRQELIDTASLPSGSLILVTCYPFDELEPGGPLRYVVEARMAEPVPAAIAGT